MKKYNIDNAFWDSKSIKAVQKVCRLILTESEFKDEITFMRHRIFSFTFEIILR